LNGHPARANGACNGVRLRVTNSSFLAMRAANRRARRMDHGFRGREDTFKLSFAGQMICQETLQADSLGRKASAWCLPATMRPSSTMASALGSLATGGERRASPPERGACAPWRCVGCGVDSRDAPGPMGIRRWLGKRGAWGRHCQSAAQETVCDFLAAWTRAVASARSAPERNGPSGTKLSLYQQRLKRAYGWAARIRVL
jgi:hypothetical protein